MMRSAAAAATNDHQMKMQDEKRGSSAIFRRITNL